MDRAARDALPVLADTSLIVSLGGAQLNPGPIFDCFSAYQKTAAMQAAVDIGLFSAIASGATTVPAIAKACEASPKGVRVLCDYWTVQGLLLKSADAYRLTPEAATFLN